MFTIEVASCTFFVCSASSVSSVNASRPHASATQIEWIPESSASLARSISALKSSLPCQLIPIVSLRAMLFSPCAGDPSIRLSHLLAQIPDPLIPSLQAGKLSDDPRFLRIEVQKEERMIHRSVGEGELPAEEK